ncbi:MAG: (2Fe-2S)-binding protein [Acidobacteriota bacterium]
METNIKVTINGRSHTLRTHPDRTVLEVLREDLRLTGTKYGCGEGQCRACTILLDGRPVTSCLLPVSRVENRDIVTIEGLAQGDQLHPVQEAFLREGAMQCGYCVPGMILTAVGLLRENANPTAEDIVDRMNGNLCRCCGYPRILAAVRRAAQTVGLSQGGK